MAKRGDLASELKRLVEGLHPDLRAYFRPSMLGKVVAVHDDDSDPETYYRVDIVIGADEEAGEQGLSLPKVPCASLFAQDGYGVWALPEVGAEVTVSFHDGDVTRPYVEAPIYYGNTPPAGFKAGTFAIRGKQGQKIELKPDTSEIVISAASHKMIATAKRQAVVGGDDLLKVGGERRVIVQSTDVREARRYRDTVQRDVTRHYGSLNETVDGAVVRKVGASLRETVSGSTTRTYVGSVSDSVLGAWQVLVGSDGYSVTTLGDVTFIGLPGSIRLNSLGGLILVGADVKYPPLAILIGSKLSPTTTLDGALIKLGGDAASEPAVLGTQLTSFLTELLALLNIPQVTGPVAANPAWATALNPLQGKLAGLLNPKILLAAAGG